MRLTNQLLLVQGVYTLLTAVWPLIDIDSFMAVTGYKTDQWLVKTVGALLIPISVTLLSLRHLSDQRPAYLLGGLTAIAFIIIDFYYSTKNIIPDIYQVDGAIEIIFLGCWLYIIGHGLRKK